MSAVGFERFMAVTISQAAEPQNVLLNQYTRMHQTILRVDIKISPDGDPASSGKRGNPTPHLTQRLDHRRFVQLRLSPVHTSDYSRRIRRL